MRRCLFRAFLMGVLVFLGELIPDFVKILDLLGSTTIALMTFILPPFFYLRLCGMEDPDGKWKTMCVLPGAAPRIFARRGKPNL